jgi:hypothetical protein
MSEPRTAAGRRLVEGDAKAELDPDEVRALVLAIEAEAAAPASPDVVEALRRIADLPPAMGPRSDAMELLHEAKEIARAALAASPEPSAGLDEERLAKALRKLAGQGTGFDARLDSGDYGFSDRPSEFAAKIAAAYAATDPDAKEGQS